VSTVWTLVCVAGGLLLLGLFPLGAWALADHHRHADDESDDRPLLADTDDMHRLDRDYTGLRRRHPVQAGWRSRRRARKGADRG
jgi:hypothetical protein